MSCPQCRQDNPPGAKFCSGCGGRLESACPGCGHANLPGSRFCNECGKPLATSSVAAPAARVSSELHASPPGREDPHLQARPRRRAQAGHRAVRRHEGLARAPRRPRPRGGAQAPRPRPRAHDGGGAPLRGHRQPGHGRRHHGALRRPAGPRGPRRARLLRRARACSRRSAATPTRSGESTASRSRSASASTPARWSCARSAATSAWTTRRWARPRISPRAWSSSRRPGSTLLTGRDAPARRGLRRGRPARSGPGQGAGEPGRGLRAGRPSATRTRLQAAAARGLTRFVGRDARSSTHLRQALDKARAGQGQVVAVVGEPGVGKSRLLWEFIHSHRTQGWLVLESSSVSYGKASAVPARHRPAARATSGSRRATTPRGIREKVTGKLLTLDESLRAMVPALPLAPGRADRRCRVGRPRPGPAPPADRSTACERLLLRESQVQPLLPGLRGSPLDRRRDPGAARRLVESLPTARILLLVNYRPEYQPRLGQQDLLQPAPARPPAARERGGAAPRAARRGRRASSRSSACWWSGRRAIPSSSRRACGRSWRPARSPASAAAIAWRGPSTTIQVPATVQAILAARIDRLPPEDKTPAPDGRRHRQGRAVRAPAGHRRASRRRRSATASAASRPPSSSTRRASSPSWSTPSSTR